MSESQVQVKPYSVKDVAQRLEVPESTIRYWSDEFPNYLKLQRTAGGQRRYGEDDIQRLEYIKKLLREEGKSIREVAMMSLVPPGQPTSNEVEDWFRQIDSKIDRLVDVVVQMRIDQASLIEGLVDRDRATQTRLLELKQQVDSFEARKRSLVQRFLDRIVGKPEPAAAADEGRPPAILQDDGKLLEREEESES